MSAAISIKGLSKSYGRHKVLSGIDLEVEQGIVYGFLGPNGAGKTTLIKILLGLTMPDSAEVEIFGMDLFLNRNRIMERVGAIVEAPVFFDYLSAEENLRFVTRLSGPVSRRQIDDALRLVGLESVAGKTVGKFSYGMRQRLGIASALLPDNKLLFLDEPTNGLDPHGIMGVRNLLRRLKSELGVTIFLSSHLLNEVEQTCDAVSIIDKGVKVHEARVDSLKSEADRIELRTSDPAAFRRFATTASLPFDSEPQTEPGEPTVFFIDRPSSEVPSIAARLVENGVPIMSIQPHETSLEEIFVTLTRHSQTDHAADRFGV